MVRGKQLSRDRYSWRCREQLIFVYFIWNHSMSGAASACARVQLNNGRLAMIAVAGMVGQELVDGQSLLG